MAKLALDFNKSITANSAIPFTLTYDDYAFVSGAVALPNLFYFGSTLSIGYIDPINGTTVPMVLGVDYSPIVSLDNISTASDGDIIYAAIKIINKSIVRTQLVGSAWMMGGGWTMSQESLRNGLNQSAFSDKYHPAAIIEPNSTIVNIDGTIRILDLGSQSEIIYMQNNFPSRGVVVGLGLNKSSSYNSSNVSISNIDPAIVVPVRVVNPSTNSDSSTAINSLSTTITTNLGSASDLPGTNFRAGSLISRLSLMATQLFNALSSDGVNVNILSTESTLKNLYNAFTGAVSLPTTPNGWGTYYIDTASGNGFMLPLPAIKPIKCIKLTALASNHGRIYLSNYNSDTYATVSAAVTPRTAIFLDPNETIELYIKDISVLTAFSAVATDGFKIHSGY